MLSSRTNGLEPVDDNGNSPFECSLLHSEDC